MYEKEIDLLIYLCQFQNGYGDVIGINYETTINEIGICKSSFYNMLYSMEKKEIIKINELSEHGYWAVTILNNKYTSSEDCKKGYINMNYQILHSDGFKKLTKAEKIIVLNILRVGDFANDYVRITFPKIKEWTGCSMRSVKKFIQSIKDLFKNEMKAIVRSEGNVIYFSVFALQPRKEYEKEIYLSHLIKYSQKTTKTEISNNEVKRDAINVLKSVVGTYCENTDKVLKILKYTMLNLGRIIPKYLNKLAQLIKSGKFVEQL